MTKKFYFLVVLIITSLFSQAFADQPKGRILKQNSDSIIYLLEGIPYPIRYAKKEKCNFSEREIQLIRETAQALPETYLTIKDNFHFEKSCTHNLKVDTWKDGNAERTHLASSQSGKITITDKVFSYVKGGQLFQFLSKISALSDVVLPCRGGVT